MKSEASLAPELVVRSLLGAIGERRWDRLPDYYAEPTDVRHPLAPGDVPLRTRDQLESHFRRAAELAARVDFRAEALIVHRTTDPELIVAEFEYRGRVADTGTGFAAPCIFVVRVRDGRIVESRDYIDQAAFRRAAAARP